MKVHDGMHQKSPTLVHQNRLIEKRRLAKFRYKRMVGCILKAFKRRCTTRLGAPILSGPSRILGCLAVSRLCARRRGSASRHAVARASVLGQPAFRNSRAPLRCRCSMVLNGPPSPMYVGEVALSRGGLLVFFGPARLYRRHSRVFALAVGAFLLCCYV